MANIILMYPNRADSGTYSNGSWATTLPANNLKDQDITKVARSTNCLLASTMFDVDLGASKPLRAFRLDNHNFSAGARVRISVGSTSGASDIYSSGWVLVWQLSFEGLIEWESSVWWLGVAGDEYLRSPFGVTVIPTDHVTGRYIRVEIDDQFNVDGYVQIGRFYTGPGFQPAVNAEFGLQDRWIDMSTKEQLESGTAWHVNRRRKRGVSFVLAGLSHIELAYLYEMQRLVGTAGQIVYLPYPDNADETQRYGMLGTMTALSPADYPFYNVRKLGFDIEEV